MTGTEFNDSIYNETERRATAREDRRPLRPVDCRGTLVAIGRRENCVPP